MSEPCQYNFGNGGEDLAAYRVFLQIKEITKVFIAGR